MLIFTLSIILIYEFTIGKQISQFSGKMDAISSKEGRKESINKLREDRLKVLEEYLKENNNESKIPKYFYEIGFEKPGGIVMPIIVKYSYADGTSDLVRYPVQLWRKNIDQVYKVITSDKEIIEVTLDPDFETSDININNNNWPRKEIK